MLSRVSCTFAISAVLAILLARDIGALEPATPLGRLARQSWTMENGLPQNTVSTLLQSRSGYLWAGTELGLARFDGVSFRIYDHAATPPFPDAEIRCILDATGGGKTEGLWVGTGDGLVRLADNQTVLLTNRDGLPSSSIQGLVETTDGAVWAWTEAGLARWTGERFQAIAPESGLPAGAITSMAAGANGDLWVGTTSAPAVFHQGRWFPGPQGQTDTAPGIKIGTHGLASYASGSLVSQVDHGDVLISNYAGIFLEHDGSVTAVSGTAALPQDGVSFLARLSDGSIAVASKSAVFLLRSAAANGRILSLAMERFAVAGQLPGSRIESIYADREGSLWIGANHGLARIASTSTGASVQLLPATDPLAANAVVSFLEDREGDLWVGTETAGLHLFRDARFRTLGAADGLSSDATTAIVEDARGSLWIGTRDAGLDRILNGQTASLTTANGLLSNVILALAAAPDGDVWAGTPDGLNRIGRTGITSLTSADGLPDDFIRSVLVAPDESVWIGTRRGLTHLVHGRFQTLTNADGLGSDLVGALARTANGDLWIATLNGLSRLQNGRLHNYTTADGLSSNVITALETTPDGMIWIGTQGDGLNLWDGKRFAPVRTDSAGRSGQLPTAIHSILRDDRGHLWLASNSGLTRVDAQSLVDCALHQSCNLKSARFTTADGLRGRETSSNSHPTACRGSNGELWFTTPRGVIVVDPLHFAATPGAPPVVVERFAVDDEDVRTSRLPRITAGHLRFQFDYAGLSFAAPQKLRYQYMLEGFDHSWTDAGIRRTAYYTNIPPGNYRFRVRTAFADSDLPPESTDGLYRSTLEASEASLSFELLPHFYQTIWFRAALIVLLASLILWVSRRRVLRVEREFRAVMRERNRIAREIHDTLAQGYVGISLQLEILGELLRHNRTEAAAKHLTVTQGLVRDGLDDARQSIWALRSQDAGEHTLPVRLRRLVEKAHNESLTANLEVHGAYRALAPEVEREILRVAQESIHNVKKHAAATLVTVRLDYDQRTLALTVTDNGKGFRTSAKLLSGHYGLTGMRERASLIRGEIEIASEPGEGTTVRLNVPVPEVPLRSQPITQKDSNEEFSTKIKE